MALIKVSLAFICITILAFVNYSNAQSSPKDYLKAHNFARSQVGVGPMQWSPTLAKYAQQHVSSHKYYCDLSHSQGPYGENLAKGGGSFMTGKYAVSLWVNEKHYYDYKSNKCIGGQCGHYTQVVWKKSVYVGCYRARCNNGYWYVSCNYYPRGNIVGKRPY